MEKYIIAVRRECRQTAPADLTAVLDSIPGLTIEGSANKQRLQVVASEQAIQSAREMVAEYASVEPIILHSRQQK